MPSGFLCGSFCGRDFFSCVVGNWVFGIPRMSLASMSNFPKFLGFVILYLSWIALGSKIDRIRSVRVYIWEIWVSWERWFQQDEKFILYFFLVHLNHFCLFSFSLKKYKVKKSFLTDTYNSLLSKVFFFFNMYTYGFEKKIDI